MRRVKRTRFRPEVESLEDRTLLSAFVADINFGPTAAPGYFADTGAVFGDRGNGLTYGWNAPHPAQVTAPHLSKKLQTPAPQYDAFAGMNAKGRGSQWEIAVPDGTYQVDITAGNPNATSGKSRILVDDVLVVNGKASKSARWVGGSSQVMVSNGLLTLTVPRGTSSRIDFIDISQIVPTQTGLSGNPSPPTNPTPPTPPAPPSPPTPNPLDQPVTWQSAASAPQALAEAQSVVAGDKLYVFGGYNVTSPDYQPTDSSEVYDPSTNKWTVLAPMPAAETHMGVATDGTYIYVAGGYTFDPKTTYQTFATTNVFRYDIATNTWSTMTSLPAARGAGALVYLDGELHFMDGVDVNRNGQTEHWILNPSDSNPQWTDSTSLPYTANHTAAVVLDGDIYLVGGQSTSNDSSTLTNVVMWDPNNPSVWTTVASMPIARSHAVVAVIDNSIIVAGGTTANDVPLDSVIFYDPSTGVWADQTDLPSARLAAVGGVIGDQIIVTTGFGSGALQSNTWIATVSS